MNGSIPRVIYSILEVMKPVGETSHDGMPVRPFATQKAWETWLSRNHASVKGIWLLFGKKGSGHSSVSYREALDAALCYGWIDGQKRPRDAQWWMQKFTPRGRRSIWSKRNRERVQQLVDEGRMRPAGLATVAAAKEDGRWEAAYDSPAKAEVPADLEAALDAGRQARAFFETLDGANRYAILWRIATAKKDSTRAARIQKFIQMLERGEKIHW
jgi:uncharacterized protein YdeI (YjbR/CyaY-like superfamily)